MLKTNSLHKYYLFTFLNSLVFFSAVLVPFFTDWGGISLARTQFLQSWFMLWVFVLEIPTGVIADYFGRKWSLILGAFVFAVGVLIYGAVPNFYIFLLGEFLLAMAISLISGADQAWVFDFLKSEKREHESKKVFGNVEATHLLGLFISAPLGGLIAQHFSLNSPMLFSAIPAFLAVLVGLTLPEPKKSSKLSESSRYIDIVKAGFTYLKNHKILRMNAVDILAITSASYFVIWLYQPLLKQAGVPIFYFGFIHAGLVAVEIVISKNFERIERIFFFISYEKLSAFLTFFGFMVVGLFPNIYTIALFIIFAGGFGLTRLAYMSAKINHLIPSEQRATILSSISMFRRFALVILNPFVGLIATQSLRGALLVVGIIPLLSLFIKKKTI